MNAVFLDATQAEVEYRAAELRRAARRSRLSGPNRVLHWIRRHRAAAATVPRQERRTPVTGAARGRA
ncbi:hypothetical protein [Amycolatopsis jiangsuensis]|uniref:Uncharacterized protein n=1 Tax=Amycolatopsis jiangsuensis TaxID=1181879 RepID=A0A840IUT0_9PSEU|nr:hypothetical protein [Amycolatopsis jiangsuensis]MBB4684908.1 hypothetical protein [Amycolatopsis jiangsuensis]